MEKLPEDSRYLARLGVNVDHVATLRQNRGTVYPDPVEAASVAESAGAHQITVHLREDRRHIQDRDLDILRRTVQSRLNLEMAATAAMVRIACRVKPDQVTLVPEKREELTTEGGLDAARFRRALAPKIKSLSKAGIRVSLFIDPDHAQIMASAGLEGVEAVELHTGEYANAKTRHEELAQYERIRDASGLGASEGLKVYAGHGLHYRNTRLIAEIPEIEELNIGHSIVARAMIVGMERAVSEMLSLIRR